ncbi:Retinoid-inducible serine carboxypeptidase [Eumeta japonica]|uniref:Retinoid-inducible serine carboxypeptidase n=1 Tax=Eumeta variegata TaxID=151549 RepID=A0A4C1U2C6_EUMVA|nr:Retinoid-inducible serine carboxypeptidase [Eumeta japonica]
MSKTCWVIVSVVAVMVIAVALTVTLLLVLRDTDPFEYDIIHLEGEGLGDLESKAAFTRFRNGANMFWWFYPSLAESPQDRPIIVWLDGVLGLPPSLYANFLMFGPYDLNMNLASESWIQDYNLLFLDAPVGTGFSFVENSTLIASTPEENVEDILYTLHSFYSLHGDFQQSPLYVFGEGHGGKLAVEFAVRLQNAINDGNIRCNFKGVALGNPVISPALVMTRLGFYLEELGYIDANGREVVEGLAERTLNALEQNDSAGAFDNFLALEETVSNEAGAVAVNIKYIIDKLTRNQTEGFGGQRVSLLNKLFPEIELNRFMDETVAPALGVRSEAPYDYGRAAALDAARDTFMRPAVDKVDHILENTDLGVWIYNGNLDALSNTPGQLLWIEDLEWSVQNNFIGNSREVIAIEGLVEGYVRASDRLHFYWMNAAGHSVPLDSPLAMRSVLQRIAGY